ncbi:helix-turn-helix transcriptional regulator [Cohnella sp. GCM10012308]|uniref:helix-turn-helix transcriptional regulator n=1 Tax=Cohnella sp. GCM10012308 TaxID=3317329 RepID=UPI0036119B60
MSYSKSSQAMERAGESTVAFWRRKTNSLLFKLLGSFMALIALLLSFNLFSYAFFRDTIQDEIIKNSSLNLGFASENYEKQLSLVRKTALQLYFNDHVAILKNGGREIDYSMAYRVQKDIVYMLSNESLYLNNLVLYFPGSGLMIEKEGTVKPEQMFKKFYLSESYDWAFWQTAFAENTSFKLYPAAVFDEVFQSQRRTSGLLLPLLIKESNGSEAYMLAFLDADRMMRAFLPPDSRFALFGPEGETLYRAASAGPSLQMEEAVRQQGYVKRDGAYLFYDKAGDSGLTYALAIPYANISSQIRHLNLVLIALLCAAMLLSVGASVLFSIRVNGPLKRIVDALKGQRSAPETTQIAEFDYIGERMSSLLRSNEDARLSLKQNETTLRYYAYINRLKAIRTGAEEQRAQVPADKPFLAIVCELSFKRAFAEQIGGDIERAVFLHKEYIQLLFQERFADAQTFQIERTRIVTLIFTEGAADAAEVLALLERARQTFELDRAYGCVTIGVSATYAHAYELISAYEEAVALTERRLLGEGTQILHGPQPPERRLRLGAAEEQELYTHLRFGNETELRRLISRHLAAMRRADATAVAFRAFARGIADMAAKTLQAAQPDAAAGKPDGEAELEAAARALQEQETFEGLERALTDYAAGVARAIRTKKEEARDPVIGLALDYIAEHYAEDLSLDIVAGKLNLTGTYLSTYFKKKQGVNFVDYLNGHRIGKAKALLADTDLQVQEIAVRTGYLNANTFIRTFKKLTGLSPGEYRKETLRDGGARGESVDVGG